MKKTRTIKKIKVVGRWVEFWWEEEQNTTDEMYHLSLKYGDFMGLIDKYEEKNGNHLYTHMMNNGLKGTKVVVKQIGDFDNETISEIISHNDTQLEIF